MIYATPIRRQLLALAMGKKNYREVSDKQWVLCPAETLFSPRAIFLDKQLDKITALQEHTHFALEMRRVYGGNVAHAATIAYRIRNASILNGYVYKGPMKHALVSSKETWIGVGRTEYIDSAALACTLFGNRYFGHWVLDDLPLILAARELAKPVTVKRRFSDHEIEYAQLCDAHATPVTRVKCGELIIIDDIGQNSHKRSRHERLRAKLRTIVGPSHTCRGVMLLRGTSGVRRVLVNEEEVAEFLNGLGFDIVDPLRMSAREIVRRVLGAKIVVGVEGSQLVHGLFAVADGGTVLALIPPFRFNNIYKDFTDCVGLKYAFVVGEPDADAFRIDLADLARTLDKIESTEKK